MSRENVTTWGLDLLTERIIGCVINTHRILGPGFLESVYQRALLIELAEEGLRAEAEKEIRIHYKGQDVGIHKIDILVEDEIVVELKAVEELIGAHYGQVKAYLKASGKQLGLLVNFSGARSDTRRIEWSESRSYRKTTGLEEARG